MKALFFCTALAITVGVHYHTHAMTIRPYDPAKDFPPVNAIIEKHKDYLYAQRNGQPFKNAIADFTQENTAVIENNESQTVGFVGYQRTHLTFLSLSLINNGHINYLGVSTAHQKQGYGKALLEHAVNDLQKQGVKRITLSVKENNQPARALYEKSGFTSYYTATTGNMLYEKQCNQGHPAFEGAKLFLISGLIVGVIAARNISCADLIGRSDMGNA